MYYIDRKKVRNGDVCEYACEYGDEVIDDVYYAVISIDENEVKLNNGLGTLSVKSMDEYQLLERKEERLFKEALTNLASIAIHNNQSDQWNKEFNETINKLSDLKTQIR